MRLIFAAEPVSPRQIWRGNAAIYDVAVLASARVDCDTADDEVSLLLDGLSHRGLRVSRIVAHGDGLLRFSLFVAGASALCIDSRVFGDVNPAAIRRLIDVALKAGRTTILVCLDPANLHENRELIECCSGEAIDVVVGEPQAVLALFGLCRIDTLVPKIIRDGAGIILHRVSRAPLVVRPGSASVESLEGTVSPLRFWCESVPAALCDILGGGDHTSSAGGAGRQRLDDEQARTAISAGARPGR